MRPAIWLDGDALRANAAAFAALGAPVAAVLKNDGYGWGAQRLARALDGVVESYVVADDDELAALRPATRRPIRLLSDAPPGRLHVVLALGGIPNVSTRDALAEAAGEAERRGGLTVRIGVLDATGWSAIPLREAEAFAAACAGTALRVELWTHVSSAARAATQIDGLRAARAVFEAAGIPVASVDAASTSSASAATALDRLRIGAGLFGARLGASVATRCALRVTAPVVRRYAPGDAAWAGYGDTPVTPDARVSVVRCGYGDGYPKGLAGSADILAIGMQYTSLLGQDDACSACVLIGEGYDVDGLAAAAGISSHELVVGLAPRQ